MALNVNTIVGLEISRQHNRIYEESILESNVLENRSSLFGEEEEEEEGNIADEDHILDILKEYLKEVDEKGHDSIKKLASKLGNKLSFIKEGYFDQESKGNKFSDYVEKLRGVVLNHGDEFTCTSRDVDLGSCSTTKMERFKVKTLNLGGGVKQEQK